jgi:excisionase family DNA binding protein
VSRASERQAAGETLAGYSLVSVRVAAGFLDCSEPHLRKLIREGELPGIAVGHLTKIDPLDLAVHVLAAREGVPAAEYWRRHGDATPEHAWRLVARIRRLRALIEGRAA